MFQKIKSKNVWLTTNINHLKSFIYFTSARLIVPGFSSKHKIKDLARASGTMAWPDRFLISVKTFLSSSS